MKQRNGSTTAWRKLRRQVLDRDDELCRLQLPGLCTQLATHVHHVVPVARGGEDHPENLVASCPPCNLAVGDRMPDELGEFFSSGTNTPAPSVSSLPNRPETNRIDH